MSDLTPGDEFAGHRIEGVAGRGGMGVVYRARQLDLDRLVALKLIAPALAQDEAFRERFLAESRAAAAIEHPNVVPIYYAGEAGGRLYIAMRFVDGEDLRTRVRREGRLSPEAAAEVAAQIGAALDAAHARGLVHRDVKPANVLLGEREHVYLTDFGLTKRVNSLSGATRTGGWVGTLGYVSPEQIRGERTDARADVYALGCVLFHALTGSTPYQRDTDEATLWAHLNEPPPPVTSVVPDVPAEFEDVIARALAKDPEERFQSAGDLGRAALAAIGRREALAPERIVATGPAAPGPRYADETVVSPEHAQTVQQTAALDARRQRTRPRTAALVGGAIAALLIAGGAAALVAGGGDDDDRGGSGGPTTPTRTTPTAKAAGRLVAPPIPVGGRPNGIVATRRYVWTISGGSTSASLIGAQRGERSARSPSVGAGATAITAGFGKVWIAKGNTRAIVPYGLVEPVRKGTPLTVPSGHPVAVVAKGTSIWVGSRGSRGPLDAGSLFKLSPSGALLASIGLPRGLQNLAVGEGGVWVIDGRRNGVTRYDIADGQPTRAIRTDTGAYAVAVGADYVWVSNETSNTVTRVNPRTRETKQIPVGRGPKGLEVGNGAVWVANSLDGTITRIDPRTAKVVGRPVRVGAGPFAISVSRRSAWVTLLNDNSVARVRF
ncbi:MAG TPA: protein kinase [Solirubrobacteraceae bacterium]